MSSYYRKFIHVESGEEHEIFAIDGYFGGRIYGFQLPSGKVLPWEEFEILYKTKE